MIGQFLIFYLVIQIVAVAALPLGARFFAFLPDRGYAFARLLGILLTGYLFWIGYSIGLWRNEIGGAWLAWLLVALLSVAAARASAQKLLPSWRYRMLVEAIFGLSFLAWAWVRAHDPAADHTEQPMDLMFLNSIRASLTYPPQDAWLAGYPISYYYFGYWLMNLVGLMGGQTTSVTYNLAQAAWFGLLLSALFGVGYNLAATSVRASWATVGGLLAMLFVGLAANLQGLLEWLYANGFDVTGVAGLFQVRGFPENAAVTHKWYVDFGWWWWRSSRVLVDTSLQGDPIEVIDEFPAFSYLLGDNHPHLAAMPFALLSVAVALAVVLSPAPADAARQRWIDVFPLRWAGFLLSGGICGALLFLNTWDYPPYWLLIVLSVAVALRCQQQLPLSSVVAQAVVAGGGLAVVGGLLYLPYFATAQSQASGFLPNLFHPTYLGQYVAMFGTALLSVMVLLMVGGSLFRPTAKTLAVSALAVVGLPALVGGGIAWAVTATEAGQQILQSMRLSDAAYLSVIVERWGERPFTFLTAGLLAAAAVAACWSGLQRGILAEQRTLLFAFLLAAVGLGLTLVPELIYLRDNFGWRMNTIFKLYYQAWLLLGVSGSVAVVMGLRRLFSAEGLARWRALPAALFSGLTVLLALASTIYLVAGVYSKTQGFSREPTFDATAYLATLAPAEYGAVEWVRANTLPDAIVVEGKGRSYGSETNRISTMTGRPTPLGWDGHESQWRGRAYGTMAAGRPEALQAIYGGSSAEMVRTTLRALGASYLYVGPVERTQYGLTPSVERSLFDQFERVYPEDPLVESDVHIYRVR